MKLLVGIDLSDYTEMIVEKAEDIARALSARVWLLHAVKPEPADFYVGGREPGSAGFEMDPQAFRDSLAKRFHSEHQRIQEIAGQLRDTGLDATALLVEGAAAELIVEQAAKLDVDMIIVGSHGHGAMRQLLLGSVSEGVLHRSKCPVLVVPTPKRSLV